MPITASPLPYISPSMIEAATPARVVGRVVGLEPHRHRARQADRVAEFRHHPAFARREDQVLIAHELANGRRHLRRDAGRERADNLRRRLVREQEIAEFADRQMRDRRESLAIMRVEDEARDLVALVRNEHFFEKTLQRNIGEAELGRDIFFRTACGNTGKHVAGARRRRLGHEISQGAERPTGRPGRIIGIPSTLSRSFAFSVCSEKVAAFSMRTCANISTVIISPGQPGAEVFSAPFLLPAKARREPSRRRPVPRPGSRHGAWRFRRR